MIESRRLLRRKAVLASNIRVALIEETSPEAATRRVMYLVDEFLRWADGPGVKAQ